MSEKERWEEVGRILVEQDFEAAYAALEDKERLDKLDSLQTQTHIDAFWSMWHDEGLDSREAIDKLEEPHE